MIRTFVISLLMFGSFVCLFNLTQQPVLADYDFNKESGLNATANKDTGAGYDTSRTVDLAATIGNYLKVVLSFLGVLFLGLIIYAGYTWMIAEGNQQEVEKAKKLIERAVIGLVVVLAAYLATSFVYNNFAWYFIKQS